MNIDTAGTYTLRYSATDQCGNVATKDRVLIVAPPPRTVLYSDGTLIINEQGIDRAENESLHGYSTVEWGVFNPNGTTNAEKYIFSTPDQAPWSRHRDTIQHVEIGERIAPPEIFNWFYRLRNCQSIDLQNLDTKNNTNFDVVFYDCKKVTSLDLNGFNTENVTSMQDAFNGMSDITSLDLSAFDTKSVTNMDRMFYYCSRLEKIYVSNDFVVTQVASSSDMFGSMSTSLTGGAGTQWASSKPKDKTYAHIDGGTSNPGYFTEKTA